MLKGLFRKTGGLSLEHPPHWTEQAACLGAEPRGPGDMDWFHGPEGSQQGAQYALETGRTWEERGKSMCIRCPVIGQCLKDYIDEPYGIWGGLDRDERRALQAARKSDSVQALNKVGFHIHRMRQLGASWATIMAQLGEDYEFCIGARDSWLRSDAGRRWVRDQKIINLILADTMSWSEIAETFRVAVAHVYKVADYNSIRSPIRRGLKQETILRIFKLSDRGATVEQVSTKLRLSERTVTAVLREREERRGSAAEEEAEGRTGIDRRELAATA